MGTMLGFLNPCIILNPMDVQIVVLQQIKVRNVNNIALQVVNDYCQGRTSAMPREALQVLDVALRHGTSLGRDVLIFRNNVFAMNGAKADITMGAEVSNLMSCMSRLW